MTSETKCKVITFIYYFIYAASIEGEASLYQKSDATERTESTKTPLQSVTPTTNINTGTFYISKNDMGWKEAYQSCHSSSAHLPRIDHFLCMKDTTDLTKRFWIEATYDTVDVNGFISRSFLYPTYCCGRVGFVEGMFVKDCADCSIMNTYLCVQDFLKSSINTSTWIIARETCSSKGGLLEQNATDFPNRTGISQNAYWINDLRALNITPVERNGKDSCAFWNKEKVEFGSCDQHGTHIETLCILDQTSINDVNVPTDQSQKTCQTTPVLQMEETSVYPDDRYISQAKDKTNPGIWSILGGTLGAFVVIIIVAIMIIILLKRRGMKKGSAKDNAPNVKVKVCPKTNDSYDTIVEESLVLEERSVTSNQMSTAQNEEPIIYAHPQKDKGTSRNLIDNKFNMTQETDEKQNIGLYSIVQKGQKEQEKKSSVKETEGLGKNLGNGDSLENMYNKVNFHRPEFQDEQTLNVYNRANFRFERLEVESGNKYDGERFRRDESSNYDTTDILNSTTDSTYDHFK